MTALLVTPPPTVSLKNKQWLLEDPQGVSCHGITPTIWNKIVVKTATDLNFVALCSNLDETYRLPWADLLLDQAVAFLRARVNDPTRVLAPSRPVDAAWHNFMLASPFYVPFCDWLAGSYIHHVTDDMTPVAPGSRLVEKTVDFMRQDGLVVVGLAWPGDPTCHTHGGEEDEGGSQNGHGK